MGKIIRRRFASVYHEWDRKLSRAAKHHPIFQLTDEDVHSEMLITLWRAWLNHDPRGRVPFEAYFWILWANHKITLYRRYYTDKRGDETLIDEWEPFEWIADLQDHTPLINLDTIPELPVTGLDEMETPMWELLALGMSGKEVRKELAMSWRRFYRVLEAWQIDPKVADRLAGMEIDLRETDHNGGRINE